MQTFDNDNLKRVFERYNEAFAAAYDRALNADETYENISTANAEEELRNSVCNSIQNWHERPLLDNQDSPTCGDVISAVDTLEGALELARYGAAFCDDELPDLVKIKLASFGQPLIDKLLAFVLVTDFTVAMEDMKSENLDIAISAEFLKLLGDWQCDLCIEPVLTRFAASGVPNDMLADAVRYFLAMTGETSLPLLLDSISKSLKAKSDLDTAGEYLLIALTDIGKENRSDAIFSCLRDAFRKMTQKAIGAICLGDYGDGRGVATLRGWLERHPELEDRQVIGEILSSIKRLGGETSDLRHRLKIDKR